MPRPFLPIFRTFQRFRPPASAMTGLIGTLLRLKNAVPLPNVFDFLLALPEANRQPGQKTGPKRGRLRDFWPHHRHSEQVGLELNQKIIGAGAAVHAQFVEMDARVLAHHFKHIRHLESDRLERRSR